MLHVLTHGVFDRGRERPSGLVLSPDAGDAQASGLFWCAGAEALPACSPLVVLTACGSAAGPERVGDAGASHFGGAFLRRGACAVVLSHDDLAHEATVALMETFHVELAGGASPAEALRAARAELATSSRWRDPFYRDLIHATGLAHVAPFAGARGPADRASGERRGESARRTPWLILAAAASALVAALFVRHRGRRPS